VFDPLYHQPVEDPEEQSVFATGPQHDRRWIKCRRPFIVTGGELTLEMLDLNYNATSKIYDAPYQLKANNGIYLIDPYTFTRIGFIATGKGTHGLYVSRDSKTLYISNRGEGSITLLDLATRKIVTKWKIPGGGSPDMGGVSADGKVLWLSGRYNAEVYAFDTTDGHLLARIKVGKGPHGLCVYPQPGRYSLGHTGVFR